MDRPTNNDSYVTVGTEQVTDIHTVKAKDRNKFLPVWKQEVRDERGRKRLHGAFTGGFSAGYFNTVGSKEGWQPGQFTSSRKEKGQFQGMRPEDFMDEEDIEEFTGGKKLRMKEEYDEIGSTEKELMRRKALSSAMAKESQLGEINVSLVNAVVVPVADTVGIKLMRLMGWREGQGLGPRRKRKDTNDIHESQFTFAPREALIQKFEARKDLHGLGYQPEKLMHHRTMETKEMDVKKPQRQSLRGGFGMGIFDEEDDYEEFGMDTDQYDRELVDEEEEEKEIIHPAIVKKTEKKKEKLTTGHDGQGSLFGFTFGDQAPIQKIWYPPPKVPREWIPKPVTTVAIKNDHQYRSMSLNPDQRRDLLGEEALKAPSRSVFSFMSMKDQEKLKSMAEKVHVEAPEVSKEQALAALKGFMPFGNDPAKQTRYRQFLEYKAGQIASLPEPPPHMIAQEKSHEILEFSKAALIYKPLTGLMASKFVSSSSATDLSIIEPEPVSSIPVPTKKFGPDTRTQQEWVPARLLCKRFNIANPFPEKADGQSHDGRMERMVTDVLDNKIIEEMVWQHQTVKKQSTKEPVLAPDETDEFLSMDMVPMASKEKVDEEHEEEEVEEYTRPSMDLFKAIFDSSDDEEEDDIEEIPKERPQSIPSVQEETLNEKTPPVTPESSTFRPTFVKRKDRLKNIIQKPSEEACTEKPKQKPTLTFMDEEEEAPVPKKALKKRPLALDFME